MKDKELLDLVRLAMTERNVSQRDMAREMETSPQNVSHWLDRTETLSKMARAKLKAWLGDRYDAPMAPMSSGDYTRAIGEIMRSDMCDACKAKAYATLSRLMGGRDEGLTGSPPCGKVEGPLSSMGRGPSSFTCSSSSFRCPVAGTSSASRRLAGGRASRRRAPR